MKKCVFIGARQIGERCLDIVADLHIKSNLELALIVTSGSKRLNFDNIYASAKSAALQIPVLYTKSNDPVCIAAVENIKPDIVFHVGGTGIVTPEILKFGVTNLHPSLLPKYRGRYSNVWAIFNGEKEHGVTLHWMDGGIDTGPIIAQERYEIEEKDTAGDLWQRFEIMGTSLFQKYLEEWITLPSNTRQGTMPQDEALAYKCPKGLPNGGEIDWSWDGAKILRFIRAMTHPDYPPVGFSTGNTAWMVVCRGTPK